MKNTTLVTAIYHVSPFSRMGGRNYNFDFYAAPFRNILNLDCNLVIYSHHPEIENVENFLKKYNFENYRIIEKDLNDYANSDKIYNLKEQSGLIDANGLVSDKCYLSNDRNHHLCLQKPYFIKNTIDNLYFDTERYYWIDAGLFHHGIFPEKFGGIEKFITVKEEKYWPNAENNLCNPSLISRLEAKTNNAELIFMGVDGREGPTSWYNDYTEYGKISHIIGGFFGGKKDSCFELYNDFDALATKVLNDGNLTLEEELLSILFSEKYKTYGYMNFDTWYHDIPEDPNYFGTPQESKCFYKLFI